MSLEKKKRHRVSVIKAMYEIVSEQSPTAIVGVPASELASRIGSTVMEAEEAGIYLAKEGLLKRQGMGTREEGSVFVIEHAGRVEAERVIEDEAKGNRPEFDPDKIVLLIKQLSKADWRTTGPVAAQVFTELDRVATPSTTYQRYETERESKWKDWPAPSGTFFHTWEMPNNVEEAKSLAYHVFRNCAESGDSGVSLAFILFREVQHASGIAALKGAFLLYFIDAIKDISKELGDAVSSQTQRRKPVPLEIQTLHQRVQEISRHLVEGGHYRQAITDTFIGLDDYIQRKVNDSDFGASLMQRVFSAKNPVLALSNNQEEQSGFMMLFTGATKAIRNQYAHSLVDPKSAEEALEWLGFASALFRLVDSATLRPSGQVRNSGTP